MSACWIIFLTVEIFIPGFGVFGITGIILLVFAIVFRTVMSGDILHLFYLLLIIVSVAGVSFLVAVRSARFGLLSKTPIIEKSTAIPKDYGSDKKNYGYLLNKKGITK